MGLKIGYARVSGLEQYENGAGLDVQVEALQRFGCNKIYKEIHTGVTAKSRPKLQKALSLLDDGDELIVYKMDRLARNMRNGLNIIHRLYKNHIKVVLLKPNKMVIDPTTFNGKMAMNMLLMFADMEHQMILDRFAEGKARSRRAGKKNWNGGRPDRFQKNKAHYMAIYNYFKNSHTAKETAKAFDCSPRTVYYVREYIDDPKKYAEEKRKKRLYRRKQLRKTD